MATEFMTQTELGKTLEDLIDAMNAVRVHTWHGKETPHAAILSAFTGCNLRAQDPKRLHRSYAQVYSQHGEDGYIAEILSRIGPGDRQFLEIGVGDGLQNTTRFLLEQGWRGIWVEGDPVQADAARSHFKRFVDNGALKIVSRFVDCASINQMVADEGMGSEFDLITVDLDYNTSHIWRALSARARVSCIEYNGSIPASVPVEVPYAPDGIWDGTNHFGAGLKTLEQIGTAKGMSLVGCDLHGVNAFFVRNEDLEERFRAPYTAENHHELPKYALQAHIGHPPSQVARDWT